MKIFEFLGMGLFFGALFHAWRAGRQNLRLLFSALAFSLAVEFFTLQQFGAYLYPQYFLMVFNVPFWIGAIWSVIIYSGYEFSERLEASWVTRSCLDGLLAVSLDLSVDAIAIRLNLWHWSMRLDAGYFGVPIQNFWAWFSVVFSFTYCYRLVSAKFAHKQWLIAPAAVVLSLILVFFPVKMIEFFIPPILVFWSVFPALGIVLVCTLRRLPNPKYFPPDHLIGFFHFVVHGFMLVICLTSGVAFEVPLLLLVGLILFVGGLWLHRATYLDWIARLEKLV